MERLKWQWRKYIKYSESVSFPWFLYMQNRREGSMTKETLNPIETRKDIGKSF